MPLDVPMIALTPELYAAIGAAIDALENKADDCDWHSKNGGGDQDDEIESLEADQALLQRIYDEHKAQFEPTAVPK